MSAEFIAAAKYAKATLELAEEKGQAASVLEELILATAMFGANDGQVVFSHPLLPAKKKKAVIAEVLREKAGAIVMSLLNLLIDKRRGALLAIIADCYQKQYQAKQSWQQAEVTTALPLSVEQMNKLKLKLKAFVGKDINLEIKLDKKLKAGAKVKLGDLSLDGTLAGRIEQLRRSMTAGN